MKYKFLITLLILLTFINDKGFAQNNYSDMVAKKLVEISTKDKKISQSDYDEFWNSTGVKSREQKINLISSMKYNFILMQEFNRSLWDCAERSWIANKEIKCETLKNNLAKLKKNIFVDMEEDFKKMESNVNYVIKSASNRGAEDRKSKTFLQNQESITLEKITLAKNKSQNMLEKINILMQPEFTR